MTQAADPLRASPERPAMTQAADPLRISPGRLAVVLGDAYRSASVEGVDVAQVVALLEPARAATDAEDPFAPWRAFDAAAGQVAGTPAGPIVTAARDSYVQALADGIRLAVGAAGDGAAGDGHALWLRCFARTVAVFRIPLLIRLAEAPPPRASDSYAVELVLKTTPLIVIGQWDEVLQTVRALLDEAGVDAADRARLHVIEAEIDMYWLEDMIAALDCLDRAREVAPELARVWDGYGSVHLRNDDLDAAVPDYQRAVELDPGLENGYAGLGLCAAARDDVSAAEAEYLRGLKECPDGADLRMNLMRLYGRPSLFAEHEKRLARLAEETVAIDPQSDYDVQVSLGNVYRDNGRHDEARACYLRAIALRPTRSQAYEERGHLELAAGDLDESFRLFTEVVRRAPGHWNGPYGRALVLEQRGEREAALVELGECLRSRSLSIRSFFHARIADTLLALDRLDQAADEVAAGLAEEPTSAELRSALYRTARQMWPVRAAGARALLDRFPLDAAAQAALIGDVATDAGDNPAAVESYREAVRLAPGNAGYARSLATALSTARQWDEARAMIEAAFGADQDAATRDKALANLENQRGHALFESDRYTEAAEAYRRAAALVPEEPVYPSNLSLAYEYRATPGHRREDLTAAIGALEVAARLSTEEDYEERLRRLRRTEQAVGRFGESILTAGTVAPLRVAVAPDLVPGIDPNRNGSDFMYQRIPEVRERVRVAVGIFIPGIRFREEALAPGGYQLEVYGIVVERGTVTPGDPGVAEVLDRLDAALRRTAWRLLRTDELDRMITEAAPGVPARARLGAGQILRALAREGIPITGLPAIMEAIGTGTIKPKQMPAALERARRAAS